MDIPALELVGKVVVTLIVLVVAWQALKFVLKSTFRLLQIGCLVAIGLLGLAWFMGWLG
jgi:hypothetical protein